MNMTNEYLNEALTRIRREEMQRQNEADALRRAARQPQKPGSRLSQVIEKLTR